ncbi:MAG: hypothetical protein MUE96_09355 [Bacteroidia bacterium]|jgi:hypothetical protein|nr:hypothetical protein [Bacteroidia bacterium]
MKDKATTLLLFVFCSCNVLLAQQPILQQEQQLKQVSDSALVLIKTITLDVKDFETDRLGNVYVVSKTNQLYKYNSEGILLSTLNYKYVGQITHVDATNPLEIYVFYKELNLVVFLDNNLAYRGELNLTNAGIGQAAAIARSYDNGIWVFDLADLQLKQLTKAGDVLQLSGNVKQYIATNSAVNFLYDNDNRIFVNDSSNGILVFTIFATYIKTIPIKGCKEVKVIGDDLFYWDQTTLRKYNLISFTTARIPLPPQLIFTDLSIEQNRLFLFSENKIQIYKY